MIHSLNINNFIIFKQAEVNFKKGLNIFTGETGAGKSLIVDSINLLLGGKSNKSFVRKNCDKAVVQGVFFLEDERLIFLLEENGIDTDDENIIITREIYENGRSSAKINGTIVNISFLKNISEYIMDIHGQFEQQSILQPENHLKILDDMCRAEVRNLLEKYTILYDEYILLNEKMNNYKLLNADKGKRESYLVYQLNEFESLNLKENEEQELSREYDLYSNINDIKNSLSCATELISGNDYSLSDNTGKLIKFLKSAAEHDNNLTDYLKDSENIQEQLQELLFSLINYNDDLSVDSEKLGYLSDRLEAINMLKRKFGMNFNDLLDFRQKLESELEELRNNENNMKSAEMQINILENKMNMICNDLHNIRSKAASEISVMIESELAQLNLVNAGFKTELEATDSFNEYGKNKAVFKIRTNSGTDFFTPDQILSGGEISRIMLAIKSVINTADKVPSMIFDEIDVGISGKTAVLVGRKIRKISCSHQVICITHSPQIAAAGDANYFINKVDDNTETFSFITELDENSKIEEIARLISGEEISRISLENARELVNSYLQE